MGGGERGGGRKSVGSGRTRFCWCDSLPFPSRQPSTDARDSLFTSRMYTQIFYYHHTVLSATTLLFADRSRRGLIIKYFLDNRIAAPRLSSGPRKWPCMLTFV